LKLKTSIIFFATGLAIIAADQLSKEWIRTTFYLGQAVPETGFFRLVYAQNTGAAFSIFTGNNSILAGLAFLEMVILLVYFFVIRRQYPPLNTGWNTAASGLILGGIIGNLVDRIRLGHVTDFISVGPWPIFNIADSAGVVGIIMFAVTLLVAFRHSNPPES